MKINDFLGEDGKIVPGVNTTVDVKPGQTEKEAKKFFGGNGKPKPLGVKGATPNQAFNLGMTNENISVTGTERGKTARKKKLRPGSEEWFKHWFSLPLMKRESFEQAKAELIEHIQKYKSNSTNSIVIEGYKLQLERDDDMYVLHITDNDTGKRTEVRGKSGYESGNYDANDELHQLLDKIGKAANISELINGEVVGINPKHPDGSSAKVATDKAYSENKLLDNPTPSIKQLSKKHNVDKDDIISQVKKGVKVELEHTSDPKIALEIALDHINELPDYYDRLETVEENFADGKKKGKSRPGRVKRAGASCDGSVTELRRKAKNSSGEKQKMYHWCANMKAGRKK